MGRPCFTCCSLYLVIMNAAGKPGARLQTVQECRAALWKGCFRKMKGSLYFSPELCSLPAAGSPPPPVASPKSLAQINTDSHGGKSPHPHIFRHNTKQHFLYSTIDKSPDLSWGFLTRLLLERETQSDVQKVRKEQKMFQLSGRSCCQTLNNNLTVAQQQKQTYLVTAFWCLLSVGITLEPVSRLQAAALSLRTDQITNLLSLLVTLT